MYVAKTKALISCAFVFACFRICKSRLRLCAGRFLSDAVEDPKDRYSHDEAHIISARQLRRIRATYSLMENRKKCNIKKVVP